MKDEVEKLIYDAMVAAGKRLGDPRLCPELRRLKGFAGECERPHDLIEALSRCPPETP